jgi:nucleoid-associated protein Lsr2
MLYWPPHPVLSQGVSVAQRTIVELVDDIDGSEASESLSFSLDGVEYSIDLSQDNASELRERLAVFVAKAQRVGGRKQRGSGAKTAVQAGGDRAQNQAIREWARGQGKRISDRGRIPAELVAEFQAAHGG